MRQLKIQERSKPEYKREKVITHHWKMRRLNCSVKREQNVTDKLENYSLADSLTKAGSINFYVSMVTLVTLSAESYYIA